MAKKKSPAEKANEGHDGHGVPGSLGKHEALEGDAAQAQRHREHRRREREAAMRWRALGFLDSLGERVEPARGEVAHLGVNR